MSNWESIYKSKLMSLEDAAKTIKSRDRVFYSLGACCPLTLVNAISKRLPELGHIDFYTSLLGFPVEYLWKKEYLPYYTHHSNFFFLEKMAPTLEKCDYIPSPFRNIESLLVDHIKANVVLFECTPPDHEGYFNYGMYGICTNEYATRNAENIIVVVNEKLPHVFGENNKIHVSKVTSIVESTHPLVNIPNPPITESDKAVAHLIVDRIKDGSTIQIGIGTLANAVCACLDSKMNLGVHTEMFVDAMVGLVEKGIINCSKKSFKADEITCSFGGLVDATYKFLDRNEMVRFYPLGFINDPVVIAKNDNFISINNTLMVDLSGQACSENLGFKHYSGTGGQVDFARGAALAKGGQGFLALSATTEVKGELRSRIVLSFPPGQVVTLPRSDTDKVVTEYGIAELKNKSVSQRAKALIAIAHPQFREELTSGAKKEGFI